MIEQAETTTSRTPLLGFHHTSTWLYGTVLLQSAPFTVELARSTSALRRSAPCGMPVDCQSTHRSANGATLLDLDIVRTCHTSFPAYLYKYRRRARGMEHRNNFRTYW